VVVLAGDAEPKAPASAKDDPPLYIADDAAHDSREDTTTSRKDGGEPPKLAEAHRSHLERPPEKTGAAWEGSEEGETTVLEGEGGGAVVWVAAGFGVNSGVGLVEGGETAGEGAEGTGVAISADLPLEHIEVDNLLYA
jgi:hypothetical protein